MQRAKPTGPLGGADAAGVVVVATFATPGLPPPPQPAASSANAATETAGMRMAVRRRCMSASSVEGGEGHVDSQAAAWSGVRGDGGVVGIGNGLNDGETEPDTRV